MQEIHSICSSYNLEFDHRIMYLPNGTVHIQGVLKETVSPSVSYYDARRKAKVNRKESATNKEDNSPDFRKNLNAINSAISDLSKDLKNKTARLQKADHEVKKQKEVLKIMRVAVATDASTSVQAQKLTVERQSLYQTSKELKMAHASIQLQVLRTKLRLKVARRDRWKLVHGNGSTKGAEAKTLKCPPPTIENPACEEACEKLDVSELVVASQRAGREIIFGGTDYGLVTMATTIRLTKAQYDNKIRLYNRYSLFADMRSDNPMEVERLSSSPKQEALSEPQSTIKCCRMTAEEINQKTLCRKYTKKLSRRKARAPQICEAEELLASNSMTTAVTTRDVLQRFLTVQPVRSTLRDFYHSKRNCKESLTRELFNKVVQGRFASQERRFVSDRARTDKKAPNTVIMCIGSAGTSVGARINGHVRRGGQQFRKRHRRYVPVAMTNEYMSSQTCSTCFNLIVHPKVCKFVNGKWKTVSNNDSSLCMKPECPSYRAGKNTQNRNAQAAACIAVAGASRLLAGQTLPCFDQTSQYNTGQSFPFHRNPPVAGAAQVPVPTGIL